MAEDNKNYALQIVQSQQNLVGASVAGGSAAVASNNIDSNSSVGILEQIRDITLKSFRKTAEIASSLLQSLNFDKQQERRQRDEAAELSKERGVSGESVSPGVTAGLEKEAKGKFDNMGLALGLAVRPIFNFIKKIGVIFMPSFLTKLFSPLASVFGKGGFLMRFLGPLGPIGLIAGGLVLLFKYSDEIIKALTPAIDKIKKLYEDNKPLIEAIKNGFDFLFKNIIGGVGRIIGGIIDDLAPLIGGFSQIIQGDIMGGLKSIGEGLLNIVLFIPRAIARLFEPVLADVESWFIETANSIKTFLVNIPGKIMQGIKSIGSAIVNFFTVTIPDAIKGAINSLIEALPLPGFVKDKMKLKSSKAQAAEDKISEFGAKEKYTDRSLNPMERQARAGSSDKLTMDEAYNEAVGEQYTGVKTQLQGTSGNYFANNVLTPDELKEYDSLKNPNERIAFLESLNKEEQERRKIIKDLYNQRRDMILNQPEPFKAAEQEFMSPDDEMNKFMTPKRLQAAGLSTQGGTGSITVINNSPTSVISQNDVKKTDVISGVISTSSGDNYFDRNAGTYAA